MRSALTQRQIMDWLAVFNVEPWGDQRADVRSAIIATTLANVNRGKNQRAYRVDEFMAHAPPKPKQTDAQMAAIFKAGALAHNNSLAQRRKKRGQ